MTAFPTLEYLVKLIGLAFADFLPIMFYPFPSSFHASQVSIKIRDVILFAYARTDGTLH